MTLNKKNITVRTLEEKDMSFIATLWGDKESMMSSGGAFKIDDSNRDQLYQILHKGDDFNNHYIIQNEEVAVGDLSIRKFDEKKTAQIDMKILHGERNKGHAKTAFKLILDYFFNTLDGIEITFEIWLVNSFAQEKLKDYGFEATLTMEDATIMTMTKERYMKGELHV